MRLPPYVPFEPQAVRLVAAAGVALVLAVDVIGGRDEDSHQAELGDTNTFAALGEVAYGLAGADTNGIADRAAGDARDIGGEEVKDEGTVESGEYYEGVVVAEGKAATAAVVGEGLAAVGAVGGDEVGNADSKVDMEAIGLEGVVLEEVLVEDVDFADPIDKHGSTDTDEGPHPLKAVVEVERQQALAVAELLLLVPVFATSMIQPHSHGLVWSDLKSIWL